MGKTEKLERQMRETRERLSGTLDELRSRAKPQRLAQEATEDLKYSGVMRFARNLQADVTSNSVPLTLLAAGLAWLAFRPAPRNQPASENAYLTVFHWLSRMTSAARENASRAGSAVQSGAAGAHGRISSLSRQTAETATAVSQTVKSATAAATEAVASSVEAARSTTEAVRNSASSAAKTVSTTARGTLRTAEKHPALFAGTALALGGTVALAIFLGRTLSDEVARLNETNRTPERITPERALALVDESALSLVPTETTMGADEHHLRIEAEREVLGS